MSNKLKIWFLQFFTPVQKLMQGVGRSETLITKQVVDKILMVARAGDILLSYEHQRFTSLFIKGFYKHAVLVVWYRGQLTVIEAVGDNWVNGVNEGGVRTMPLEEWLYKKDHVAIIRTSLAQSIITSAWKFALTLLEPKRNYDYTFSHENETIYCSELPYMCFRKFCPEFLDFIPEDKEILPQMYLDFCSHNIVPYFEKIMDTRENLEG